MPIMNRKFIESLPKDMQTAINSARPASRRRGKWNAVRTADPVSGIVFPSKTEARVWQALVATFGIRNVRRPRALNLWCQAPGDGDHGKPGEFRPDFVVLGANRRPAVYVDAKSGDRRSPEWKRGAAAFRESYDEPLCCWDGKGELPAELRLLQQPGRLDCPDCRKYWPPVCPVHDVVKA